MSELLIHDAEGQEQSPLDYVASKHSAADQSLIDKNEEGRVLAMFKDDPEATQVLHGLIDGLRKNEIMPKYGLTKKEYMAAVKRIRLKVLSQSNGGAEARNMTDKNHYDHLEKIMNRLTDSVLGLSDEALLAETTEAGPDAQREAERTRSLFRRTLKVLDNVNKRLSNLGHTVDSNDWHRGHLGFHNTCVTCGSFVSFTTRTGEIRGEALEGRCPESDRRAIRTREASRR
jgi:hypothetical protein